MKFSLVISFHTIPLNILPQFVIVTKDKGRDTLKKNYGRTTKRGGGLKPLYKKDMKNVYYCIWKYYTLKFKRPIYIFAFGEYNSKQVNVSGIKIFRAQFQSLKCFSTPWKCWMSLTFTCLELYTPNPPNANIYTDLLTDFSIIFLSILDHFQGIKKL